MKIKHICTWRKSKGVRVFVAASDMTLYNYVFI